MLNKTITVKLKQTTIIIPSIIILTLASLSLIFQPLSRAASAIDNNVSLNKTSGSVKGNEQLAIAGQEDFFKGKRIMQTSAGRSHSLALDDNGQVYSWGTNTYGQLGNGNNNRISSPTNISTSGVLMGKKIIQVSAGSYHNLALDSEGKIYSWGYNEAGQLGDGSFTDSNLPTAVDVSGVLTGKKISFATSGYYYNLSIDTDGKLYSWGDNGDGQLGNGASSNSNTPILVNFGSLLDRTITSITFDGVEALSFNVVDGKTIEVVTPPHAAGKVDVVITADDGAVWTITQGYEYVDNSSPEQPTSEVPSGEIEVPSTGYKNKSNFK